MCIIIDYHFKCKHLDHRAFDYCEMKTGHPKGSIIIQEVFLEKKCANCQKKRDIKDAKWEEDERKRREQVKMRKMMKKMKRAEEEAQEKRKEYLKISSICG